MGSGAGEVVVDSSADYLGGRQVENAALDVTYSTENNSVISLPNQALQISRLKLKYSGICLQSK